MTLDEAMNKDWRKVSFLPEPAQYLERREGLAYRWELHQSGTTYYIVRRLKQTGQIAHVSEVQDAAS